MRIQGNNPAPALMHVGPWGTLFTAIFVLSGALRSAHGQALGDHGLGLVTFPTSCSRVASAEFTRGVALLHHMTYPAARDAFEHTARLDPSCAMAHWGIAMTLFQPLWPTRPTPRELQRGWEAVQTARRLAPPTERERLFVTAAAAFFQDPRSADYWQRIRRWERAMATAYAALPRDPEVAAFYALAQLAIAPPNVVSRAHADTAARILLDVYRRNPGHPGAMHYLVHADDVPGRERDQLDIVRTYEQLAPDNPHALHMPTHIYTRLGEWDAVVAGNRRAASAALAQRAGDRGQFVWDEFPHAIEYLVYAYLQQGKDDSAAAAVRRLYATAGLQPTFKTAFHLASTRARLALEQQAWSEAASLAPREPAFVQWDRFPWGEAITWFARGLGCVHTRDLVSARMAADRMDTLEAKAAAAGEDLFARNIRILRLELRAWMAQADRRADSAVALMNQAADIEGSTPKHAVTPAPTIPAFELLGDLFMDQRRPADALAAYEKALALYPKRFNALLGAARAARATGDMKRARSRYDELLSVGTGSTRTSALSEARDQLRP